MSMFRGGIHPWDGKIFSKHKEIIKVEPGEELVFPVSQHIGAPAEIVVEVGEQVKMGQLLCRASGFVSAHIFSSVSGRVKGIEPRLLVNGTKCLSVIVENDGLDTPVEQLGETRDPSAFSREEILQLIQESGIVGMGGACFPTHVKLAVKEPEKVEYILVNGSECEPYLTSDYRIMLERPEKLLRGLELLLSLFPKAQGVICIEDNKPEAIRCLKKLIGNNVRMKITKTKYPQGAERMLIYSATGRKLNSSMLPIDAGCIVNNIDTVVAIGEAVLESTPLMRRIVTVTGDAVSNPGNFEVRLGTDLQRVMDAAGGLKQPAEKIISGGPMMGTAIPSLSVPVTKNATAIVALSKDESAVTETACIRCGRCVEHCPEGLLPQKLADLALHRDYEAFERLYGMECFSCGCCSYSCPAKRPLTQLITAGRTTCLQLKRQGGKKA